MICDHDDCEKRAEVTVSPLKMCRIHALVRIMREATREEIDQALALDEIHTLSLATMRDQVNVTETPGANIFRCGHRDCEANATIHYSGSVQAHRCAEHPIEGFARPAKQESESVS